MKSGRYWLWGVALLTYAALVAPTFRPAAAPTLAVITAGDAVFQRVPLSGGRTLISVPGPRGETVVEVAAARARIVASPCPNKICVRRGWLVCPGEAAICVPNRVAVYLE